MTEHDMPTPTDFIAGWERTKVLAREALERCRKAEAEAAYCRGEADALRQTCQALEARNRTLTEEAAEFKMLLNDLGRRFLEVIEESRTSPYRKPGSVARAAPNGDGKRVNRKPDERLPTLSDPGLENNLRELEREISEQIAKKD